MNWSTFRPHFAHFNVACFGDALEGNSINAWIHGISFIGFMNTGIGRGEYMSKKSETVYLPICGILKLSIQLNQKIVKLPIKIFKQSQNEGISFQAKLKNTTNSHPKFKKGIKRGPNLRKKATLTRQEGYILQFRFFPKLLAKCLHVKIVKKRN